MQRFGLAAATVMVSAALLAARGGDGQAPAPQAPAPRPAASTPAAPRPVRTAAATPAPAAPAFDAAC